MKNSKTPNHDWDPCHPGMIQEAAQESVSRRRLLQIIGAGTALGVVCGGTFLAVRNGKPGVPVVEGLPGGIACITVHDHLIAFVAHDIEDEELRKKIGYHLLKCRSCRTNYDDICGGNTSGCEARPKKALLRPCQHHAPAP